MGLRRTGAVQAPPCDPSFNHATYLLSLSLPLASNPPQLVPIRLLLLRPCPEQQPSSKPRLQPSSPPAVNPLHRRRFETPGLVLRWCPGTRPQPHHKPSRLLSRTHANPRLPSRYGNFDGLYGCGASVKSANATAEFMRSTFPEPDFVLFTGDASASGDITANLQVACHKLF